MITIPNRHQDTEAGLHRRYEVRPLDKQTREPKEPDAGAVYFVLRLDHGCHDPNHLKACHVAALAYARAIGNDRMASDMRELVAFHAGVKVAKEIVSEIE